MIKATSMYTFNIRWRNIAGILTFTFLGFTGITAHAHGGGLNAEGCHTNHKTGDYHCHRSPSVAARTKQPTQQAEPSNEGGRPTCYTGPRGGTYTITPSGRKNYKGC